MYYYFESIFIKVEKVEKNSGKQTPISEVQARISLSDRNMADAELVAKMLKDFGFDIKSISKWGIGLTADKATYEKVFQAKVDDRSTSYDFASKAVIPECFGDRIRAVYFPTKPTTF
jgi:hypothetical protein